MNERFRDQLEIKKQKIEEMRKMRRMREEGRNNPLFPPQNGVDGPSNPTMTPQELNELLQNVGIMTAEKKPELNGMENTEGHDKNHDSNGNNNLSARRPCNLEIMSVQTFSVLPKNDVLSYCKTTQTDEERIYTGEFSISSQELAFDDEMSLDENAIAPTSFDESPSREIRKHLHALQFHPHQTTLPEQTEQNSTLTKMPDLTEEEKRQIINSSDFARFFQQSARVVERVLAEDVDIFTDYVNGLKHEEKVDSGKLLVFNREFSQELTNKRMVRALDYSTFYPELLAVAYDRNSELPLSSEGIVNVWNTKFKTPPEMTFYSSSQVTSMLFDSFQSNIIIGGCYSGQICIWDTRVNKRTPVCRTQLALKAHTHPILCMKMVGSQNAHDLVTVSTDGRLCSWSVDNLQKPIDSVSLMCRQKKAITALSMAFFYSDINNFVIGGEESQIYVGDRHGQKGEMSRSIPAHEMPITCVDLHRCPGSVDFSPLCLSGSMDFNVKLWNLKDQTPQPLPLLSLERKHKFYMVDVQWSPVHPAVFVSASADGTLNLWNLNMNFESPVASVQVGKCIRRVIWNKNGQQLTVGDGEGRVYLYDVHESLYNAKATEWDDFVAVIDDIKSASGQQQLSASIV